MLDSKSLSIIDHIVYPIDIFNITDPNCNGQIPYRYYSYSQLATSTPLTLRFNLQHDTQAGHWYFDDISVRQNDNYQLITNGDFESNLTGWKVNISSEIYVDTLTTLAHSGSGYLSGRSKNKSRFYRTNI